ncbi:MAG: MBL fold metallo-hydrolase [Bacteroidaceae bacterium]|nr:MBL fold metallo-hydrolase [Bacteroidaceae bacterium]
MPLIIVLSLLAIVAIGTVCFLDHPSFGRLPRGQRLERIQKSPNYRDGQFRNQEPTQQLTSDKGLLANLINFLFSKPPRLRPDEPLPITHPQWGETDRSEDCIAWFGHSSYLLQTAGQRILVDPVFYDAAPVSFVNRPFRHANAFRPSDLPDSIDVLLITHDHWDHLDYRTVKELRERVQHVVVPLGIGEYFEYWGYPAHKITELDWDDSTALGPQLTIHCLPTRHFSGRGLHPNKTLWASYMVQTDTACIYIGGDGGYDGRFRRIGQRFPHIDLAILENGQYDKDWAYIHTMPEQLGQVVRDLNPRRFITVHHSKYALAKHPWDEPLHTEQDVARQTGMPLVILQLGQIEKL